MTITKESKLALYFKLKNVLKEYEDSNVSDITFTNDLVNSIALVLKDSLEKEYGEFEKKGDSVKYLLQYRHKTGLITDIALVVKEDKVDIDATSILTNHERTYLGEFGDSFIFSQIKASVNKDELLYKDLNKVKYSTTLQMNNGDYVGVFEIEANKYVVVMFLDGKFIFHSSAVRKSELLDIVTGTNNSKEEVSFLKNTNGNITICLKVDEKMCKNVGTISEMQYDKLFK